MAYRLEYTTLAARQLERLDTTVQGRLIAKIEGLGDNPRPPGSLKLSGQDAYRLRVGDYRVIYGIQDSRLLILIIEVGHRREIYRGL